MDQIRDLLMSWQAMDVINLAKNDRKTLISLINLLNDGDNSLCLRVLRAIEGVLSDPKTKTFILKNGFEPIIGCLASGDSRIVYRSTRVLSQLLKNLSLDTERFLRLVSVMAEAADCGDPVTCLSLIELGKQLEVHNLEDGKLDVIRSIARSGPLGRRLMGLRVLLNLGKLDGLWRILRESIEDMVSTGNALFADLALDFLDDALRLPPTPEMMEELVHLIPPLRKIETEGENVILRSKARELRSKLGGLISSYYRSRGDEALRLIKKLLDHGHEREALSLVLAIGDPELMSKIWTEIRADPRSGEAQEQFQTA